MQQKKMNKCGIDPSARIVPSSFPMFPEIYSSLRFFILHKYTSLKYPISAMISQNTTDTPATIK